MPKGRMLNKKISYDEKVARLPLDTVLLYTWCIPNLDVEGRIYAQPEILKGTVVPFIKELTLERIQECLEEMAAAGLITLYSNGHQYMQFKGFQDNQKINRDREAKSEIPAPEQCKEILRSNSGVTPAKVKLSKVNINKTPEPPAGSVDNSVNKELKEALEKVYKDGFNIYGLLNQAKAKLKHPGARIFPDEVLIAVCDEYWKYKGAIRDAWPWFERVLVKKYQKYNANQNIAQAQVFKQPGVMSLKEIMEGIGKHGK